MKYAGKKWSMDALGHGGSVATVPTQFDDDLEIHERGLKATIA